VEGAPNGLAGNSSSAKKKVLTASMVSVAHPTSGSVSRWRNLWTTSAMYTVRTSTHSRIEPWRAAHSVATL